MADGVLFIDAEDKVALVNAAGRALRNLTGGAGRPLRDCHPKASHSMLDRVMALPPERRRRRAGALDHQGAGGALRDDLRAREGPGRRVPRARSW